MILYILICFIVGVHNTIANPYLDAVGMECYYIDGIGEKLSCRFIELEDEKEEMIIESKKELCVQ